MARHTSYADREEVIRLHQAGQSYRQLSQTTGWSYETVRQICRSYRHEGGRALHPQPLGRPPAGPLSTFDERVRFAVLRLKRQHPQWGPDVIAAELHNRQWAAQVRLPSVSRIAAYISHWGVRLLRPRRQLPPTPQGGLPGPHHCWQLDVTEFLRLPGYGWAHLLNIVDSFSGVKVAARLWPAEQAGRRCRVRWPAYQVTLRQAFSRWGLPDAVQTDSDQQLVSHAPYPFPMAATLWLVALGIGHRVIQRVTQNGMVERVHRTWQGRLVGYGPLPTLDAWQEVVEYERWRMNALLPSRGRGCRRQPPLLVYPSAATPLRYYRKADELALMQASRVERYLSQGYWLRRTSDRGQFTLNDTRLTLGVAYRHAWVAITFAPPQEFQVTLPPDPTLIRTFHLPGLTPHELCGLPLV